MARYIDADKLIEELKVAFDAIYNDDGRLLYSDHICVGDDVEDLIKRVNGLPTADVVEVKHSKWVVTAYDNQDNILVIDYIKHQHSMPYCLNCKGDALLDGGEEYVTSDYCPYCGAKMDGGKTE